MKETSAKAEKYIKEYGSNLQRVCIDYLAGRADKQRVAEALRPFQNPDGGWANGLEIEYPGTVSSPVTTAAALGHIFKFGLRDLKLFEGTLQYLKNTQHENGMWDDSEQMLQYPHPTYMGPGVYPEYKTGMILKWLLRFNVSDQEMLDRAQSYLIGLFDEVALKNDFWSAVAYANAFALRPHLAEYPKIMAWSMKILIPPQEQFGWQQAMGMMEDDVPIPDPVYDITLWMIKENQEPDGGWPHPFGTYNRVWAAISVVSFLKNQGLIYQTAL